MASLSKAEFCISVASSRAELEAIVALFRAYAAELSVDLSAQHFDEELAGLPGAYAPPAGALLLARSEDDRTLGCIAIRPLRDGACEVKRFYVAPEARKLGLGRALIAASIEHARRAGYREIKLDTLPAMQTAIKLYESFGFAPIAPYGSHPYPGLICLGKPLGN